MQYWSWTNQLKNFVTSHATTCLMAFRLQAVCQPFEWLGHPFARNINPFELLRHPLIKNIKLFEWPSHLFIEGVRPFEWLGHPFAEDIRPFEQLGHPYNVIWHPFEFSVKRRGRRVTQSVQNISLVQVVCSFHVNKICSTSLTQVCRL